MKLESVSKWMNEFYPVEAKVIAATGDVLAMVEHAIKKWDGLRDENLKKYDIEIDDIGGMKYVGDLQIGSRTCSLCVNFIGESYDACEQCPLFQSLGHRCDNRGPWDTAGWGSRLEHPNPKPMIAALEATKQFILDGKYDPNYEHESNEDDE